MKRIIVVVLLLFLVAGGGVGALIMFGVIPNPFNPDVNLTAEDQAPKKVFPEQVLTFVEMEDLIIPVIINGDVVRRIYISARLDVKPPAKDVVEKRLPQFQDAVIKDLVPYFQTYFLKNDLIDVDAVKSRLASHGRRIYGEALNDVLLVNLFEQGSGMVR